MDWKPWKEFAVTGRNNGWSCCPTYDNPTYVARAVAQGACDYVLKGSTKNELVSAINSAAAGQPATRTGELRRVQATMATREPSNDEDIPLTQRELQVLRHIALGLSNKEIGRAPWELASKR